MIFFLSLERKVKEAIIFLEPDLCEGDAHFPFLAALPSPALYGVRYPFLTAGQLG